MLLFTEDMRGLYLVLGQGVAEVTKALGRIEGRQELRHRAEILRAHCSQLASAGFTLDGNVNLTKSGALGTDYKAATIAHSYYAKESIPADGHLLDDLEKMLQTYDRYLETKSDHEPSKNDQPEVVQFWIVRTAEKQIRDQTSTSYSLDIGDESDRLFNFYKGCIEKEINIGDVVLLLDEGLSSEVLAEGSINESSLVGHTFNLDLDSVKLKPTEVSPTTNHQIIVPALFTRWHGVDKTGGATMLTREYLDKTRKAYLMSWNPEKWSLGGAGTEEGRLGLKKGERTTWTCHTKGIKPGDPIFIVRVGSKWPRAIIAKGRACSFPQVGPHWDEDKKGKEYRFVLAEFEEIRDGLNEDALEIEELENRFPDQKWSPQSSGIEIRAEYRDRLHRLWNGSSETHWILKLFRTYIENKSREEWRAGYRETTQLVASAKNDHSLLDEDLLETIWFRSNNGIAHAGQGQLPRKIFENLLPKLRDFTLAIFQDPSAGTFDTIISEFETLKAGGEVELLSNLVFSHLIQAAT